MNHLCHIVDWDAVLFRVGGWHSYHRGFDWEKFPGSRRLKDNFLTLPIHQNSDKNHMPYIAECIKLIAKRNADYHSR
jgi:hypothetical protein